MNDCFHEKSKLQENMYFFYLKNILYVNIKVDVLLVPIARVNIFLFHRYLFSHIT